MDPACTCFDRNHDAIVDAVDLPAFTACASGPNMAADADCAQGPSGIASDDFNAFNLDPARWSIVDPRGDCTFSIAGTNTPDARLVVSIPSGASHAVWSGGISAPHLAQASNDTDFEIEAKFESTLSARYQAQGILVQQDADVYIRFETYSDGLHTYFFTAIIDHSQTTQVANTQIAGTVPPYLRVTRQDDLWTARHSVDAVTWTVGAQMTRTIQVSSVGPYFGNEDGAGSPAFTGIIDYFFNTAEITGPEDGALVQDSRPPNLFGLELDTEVDGVMLRWRSDEPADARVDYGTTPSCALGSATTTVLSLEHAVRITGLQTGVPHYFRITSADALGHSATWGDVEETPGTNFGGPYIDVWYGDEQTFGTWGMPQPAVNVLGNAFDADGLAWLGYSLNDRPMRVLSVGPNLRRLAQAGDFNADVAYADLLPGSNTLLMRAVDGLGNIRLKWITLTRGGGNGWPLPYAIHWNQASEINAVAQITDGAWMLETGSVRPLAMAYDRLIALGDLTWQDYQVTVPITVHAVDPNGYAAPSFGPGVGVLCRWPGHSDDGSQPWQGIYPLGGIGMYRWTTGGDNYQLYGNNGVILAAAPPNDVLSLNITYQFKMRVQTVGSNVVYRLKTWPADQFEPLAWKLVAQQSAGNDPGSGSVLLLAHHVDASFGDVTVVPGPFP